ncbi:hypothetical protein GGI17_006021 [Coemansia sp. S146]|nr:hypothetical protein GGI17_006021 [Coemansia sp. S146]
MSMESLMFEHLYKLIDGLIERGAEPGSPALKQVKQYLRALEASSVADIPALSVDSLNALGAFDALDSLDIFDAVPCVAPAAADFPVVVLDDPDSSTLAGAILSVAPSVTPTAPAAASSPEGTLTTMAFLALVTLRATLTADSPAVALDDMALTDTGASVNTFDTLPHLPPTVATTVTETNSAAPATYFTTDARAAALDNSEIMAPPAKRQRTGILYDSNGNLVTRADLSRVFGPFPFLLLSRMCALYHQLFGRPLDPNISDIGALRQTLEEMEGFCFLSVQVKSADSDRTVDLAFLQCDGPEFVTLRQQTRARLGLPKGFGAPIPEPLMCYSLAMLVCIPIGNLSRTVLTTMFQMITRSGLGSLRVVSSSGTNLMSTLDPCEMVRNWLRSLCQYIMEGGSVRTTLGEAATCHKAYNGKCNAKGNTKRNARTHMDPTGEVAKEMLDKDEHNSLILLFF